MKLSALPGLCALLVTLPSAALAEDYTVSGPPLAGTATVTDVATLEDDTTQVEIEVSCRRSGERSLGPKSITGTGIRKADGSLVWNHTVKVETWPS